MTDRAMTGSSDTPDKPAALTAAERLALSREQLRLAMTPTRPARRRIAAEASASGVASEPAATPDWLERLHEIPGVALVLDVVETWWARHPMRSAALVASDASQALVRPLAQRNPLRLVLVAFVVGAILSKMRPWRWLLRRTLFAGLLPQLALRIATEIPVQKWLAKLDDRAP